MWKESKLLRPQKQHHVIMRSPLYRHLDSYRHCDVLLCSGAAGMGKTTAIAQWLATEKYVSWLTLDEQDNVGFPYSLFSALAMLSGLPMPLVENPYTHDWHQQDFDHQLHTHLSHVPINSFLVIDNYHFLKESTCHQITHRVIQLAPKHLSVILISRHDPVIALGHLRLEKTIASFQGDLWKFNQTETRQYMPQNSEKQARHYHALSGGWPALLCLLEQVPEAPSWVEEGTRHHSFLSHCPIWAYLEEELWEPLTHSQRQAVIALSVIKQAHPNVISHLGHKLAGESQWFDELRRLSICWSNSQNSHLDYWQFPALLNQFYVLKNQQLNYWSTEQLHYEATLAWQGLSARQAFSHAILSHDERLLADTLQNLGAELLEMNEVALLQEGLAILAPSELQRSPMLALLKCWIDHLTLPAADFLNQLEHELGCNPMLSNQSIQGDVHAIQAHSALQLGRLSAAQRLAEKALFNHHTLQKRSQIIATLTLAEIYHHQGENARSQALAQQAEKLARQQQMVEMTQTSLLLQAKVKLIEGAISEVQQLVTRSELEPAMPQRCRAAWQDIQRHSLVLESDWLGLSKTFSAARKFDEDIVCQLQYEAIIAYAKKESKLFQSKIEQLLGYIDVIRGNQKLQISVSRLLLLFWDNQPEMVRAWLDGLSPSEPSQSSIAHQQWRNVAKAQFILGQHASAFHILETHLNQAVEHQLTLEVQSYLWVKASFFAERDEHEAVNQTLETLIALKLDTNSLGDIYLEPETLHHWLKRHSTLPVVIQLVQRLQRLTKPQLQQQALFTSASIQALLTSKRLPTIGVGENLTEREWQVFDLIRQSWKNEDIAWQLNVAPSTLKTHIRHLYQKLGVANRAQAKQLAERLTQRVEQHLARSAKL